MLSGCVSAEPPVAGPPDQRTETLGLSASYAADRDQAQLALDSELVTLTTSLASGWDDTLEDLSPAQQADLEARCAGAGLPGDRPSIVTDGRGLLLHLSACEMGLGSSATTATTATTPEAIARAWIRDHAELFGLDADELGQEVVLDLVKERPISGGRTLLRFSQSIDGLPVFTAGLKVVVDDAGSIVRVGGHLTPRWAVTDAANTLTPSVAKAAAASEADAPDSADSEIVEGIFDPAKHADHSGEASIAWRVKVAGKPTHPWVYLDTAEGSVLSYDSRVSNADWADLPAADRHIEAFSQGVKECTDWDSTNFECDGHSSTVDYHSFIDETTANTLYGELYRERLIGQMLQFSTLIVTTSGAEDQCEDYNSGAGETAQSWSFECEDTGTGGCVDVLSASEEFCGGAGEAESGSELKDALESAGAFVYEWTGRVGWDDDDSSYHRLRAVTDFEVGPNKTEPLDYCDPGTFNRCRVHKDLNSKQSPGTFVQESALIAVSHRLADVSDTYGSALDFTVAHEFTHGVDFSEGQIEDPNLDTSEWIIEGLADVMGVLRQAYARDPDGDSPTSSSSIPDWFKGIKCDSNAQSSPPDCPCSPHWDWSPQGGECEACNPVPPHDCPPTPKIPGKEDPLPKPEGFDFDDPSASGHEVTCNNNTYDHPLHLTETNPCDGGSDNSSLIIKIFEMMGQSGTSETLHGVEVKSVQHTGTSYDYVDMAQLVVDTLVAMTDPATLPVFYDELYDASHAIDPSAPLTELASQATQASQAVGLWSLDRSEGFNVAAGEHLDFGYVSPTSGSTWYVFDYDDTNDDLGYRTRTCDFTASCSWSTTRTQIATGVGTPPTVVDHDDKMFIVYAETDDELQMIVLDEDGNTDSSWPTPIEDESDDAKTDATPSMVRYVDGGDDYLFLFFKEAGSGAQDIRAMEINLDAVDPAEPTWTALDKNTNAPHTKSGVSAASGHERFSISSDVDKIYVAFHAEDQTALSLDEHEVGLWDFNPADPDETPVVLVAGASGSQPALASGERPLVAWFREHLHVAGYTDATGASGTFYTRCDSDGTGGACSTWGNTWLQQGNTTNRPLALQGYLPSQRTRLDLFQRTSADAVYARSKWSA